MTPTKIKMMLDNIGVDTKLEHYIIKIRINDQDIVIENYTYGEFFLNYQTNCIEFDDFDCKPDRLTFIKDKKIIKNIRIKDNG